MELNFSYGFAHNFFMLTFTILTDSYQSAISQTLFHRQVNCSVMTAGRSMLQRKASSKFNETRTFGHYAPTFFNVSLSSQNLTPSKLKLKLNHAAINMKIYSIKLSDGHSNLISITDCNERQPLGTWQLI